MKLHGIAPCLNPGFFALHHEIPGQSPGLTQILNLPCWSTGFSLARASKIPVYQFKTA
jgi:hypothetical protein